MNSSPTPRRTSSTELPAGRSPSSSQDGRKTAKSGQAAARASRSAEQAAEKALTMRAISGPPGSSSSASAALQSFLESRLGVLTAERGSPLYKLTWKRWDMPWGAPICALRASVPRTSGRDCSGWPTPTAKFKAGGEYSDPEKALARVLGPHSNDLRDFAKLAGWATPAAREAGGTAEQFLERKRKAKAAGKQIGVSLTSLNLQAQGAAGWATPSARDHRTPNAKPYSERGGGKKGQQLNNQAAHALPGTPSSGSSARTAHLGRLNPDFTRWLMGFPDEWLKSAPSVTRSSRKSQRRS